MDVDKCRRFILRRCVIGNSVTNALTHTYTCVFHAATHIATCVFPSVESKQTMSHSPVDMLVVRARLRACDVSALMIKQTKSRKCENKCMQTP